MQIRRKMSVLLLALLVSSVFVACPSGQTGLSGDWVFIMFADAQNMAYMECSFHNGNYEESLIGIEDSDFTEYYHIDGTYTTNDSHYPGWLDVYVETLEWEGDEMTVEEWVDEIGEEAVEEFFIDRGSVIQRNGETVLHFAQIYSVDGDLLTVGVGDPARPDDFDSYNTLIFWRD